MDVTDSRRDQRKRSLHIAMEANCGNEMAKERGLTCMYTQWIDIRSRAEEGEYLEVPHMGYLFRFPLF